MAPMTPDRIQEIRERAEKATPGPWKWGVLDDSDLANPELFKRWTEGGHSEDLWPFVLQGEWHNDSTAGIHVHNPADAELIAHAPQDITDLLAALATAEAQLTEARRQEREAIAAEIQGAHGGEGFCEAGCGHYGCQQVRLANRIRQRAQTEAPRP